ncbi:MAG: amino acid ABC transporter permease [Rhodospirillaceae bacterium]|nr:amino acid ABC transporter permease [Rhodospirillaceae bacterium]
MSIDDRLVGERVEEKAIATQAERPTAGGHPTLPPPVTTTGPLGWLRANLFSSWLNALLTLAALALLYFIIPPLLDWAVIHANWQAGTSRADCVKPGACWTMVRARFGQFIYGFYPDDQRWRVDLTFALFFAAVAALLIEKVPGKRWVGLFLFVVFPVIAFVLLYGGFGLPEVRTALWGGLMLTLVLAVVGIVASLPIGVLLALGRRSTMPIVRLLCTAFIEVVRAVPLITVLFMASVMLPLFLPEGVSTDKLLRALVGISLFGAAYMAEVVRGGLQAIPRGQYEGALAMGLSYWQMMRLVILPQALRIVIPGIVNSFIGLFMDTSLVLIIGFFELLGIVQAATRDANWIGLAREGFAFAAVVYFIFCFAMSRYSIYLERRLHAGPQRR